MARSSPKSSARLLALMLAGSWRQNPTPFECPAAELEEVVPLLIKSGSAALCWRRIRQTSLRNLPAAIELQGAYRRYSLQAALHERSIEEVVTLLRAAGIEP